MNDSPKGYLTYHAFNRKNYGGMSEEVDTEES